MDTDTLVPQTPKLTLAGRIVSGFAVFMLSGSAFMKISLNPGLLENLKGQAISPELVRSIGFVELACAVIFAVPQTAFLGALLLTGYLGGAVFAHVRTDMAVYKPIIPALVVWVGLALREPRVRGLLFRR